MTTIKVEGMHCGKCVERIEKAMSEAGLEYKVRLADKNVQINGCEHCVKTAMEILDDLGFDGEIEA